jgi:hypothetical protein
MPWSKTKPFPYWLNVDGVGVMTKRRDDGQMVGRTVTKLDAVSPTSYNYGALNKYKEKPFVLGPLTGGLGETVQLVDEVGKRYRYGKRVDCSISGHRRAGPLFESQMVLGGSIVNQIENGKHAGAGTVFALVGSSVYRLPSPSLSVLSRAFGAAVLQGVQFRGTAGSDRFWVTTEAGELWGYDGAAWAQAVLPGGFLPTNIEKVGSELHLGGTDATGLNVVRVCTAGDPLLPASWGGALYLGDYGKRITWLRAIGTRAYYFKEDGVFSITNDGGTVTINDLFPEFRNVTVAHYGRNAAPWAGYLWFQFGDGFWRLDRDGTLDPIGHERLNGLDVRLRRPGVCFAGHGTWFGYLATEATDLLKFGTWVNPGSGDPDEFVDSWNGSLADWNTKTATFAYVTSVLDGTPWLLIGFTDGSIERTALPQYSPDPADDERCQFVTGGVGEESYVEWPDHHAMAQADNKHWRAFAAIGPRLDATHYVTVDYKIAPDDAWTPLADSLTVPASRVVLPSTAASQTIYVRENLHGTRDETPKIEAVVLHEQVRPALQIEFDLTAIAANNVARRDGSIDRRTASQIRARLMQTAGPGPTSVVLPDESQQEVDFVDYGEALRNVEQRWGLAWDIPVKMVQWEVNTIRGTVDRFGPYWVDDLVNFDIEQLGTL